MTGPGAQAGIGALEGADVAVKLINDAGGASGRKMEIVVGNDAGDAIDATAVTQKLISVDKISVGVANSGTIAGTRRYYDAAHLATVYWGGQESIVGVNDPLLWRTTPGDSQLGTAIALFAFKMGYKHPAFVYGVDDNGTFLGNQVRKAWTKLCSSCTVAADVHFASQAHSYRSEAQTVVNSHPDVILFRMYPAEASPWFSALKELGGLNVPMVGDDSSHETQFIDAVGLANQQKVVTSIDTGTISGPGFDAFTKAYMSLQKHPPLGQSNYTYDAVTLLALAIQKAGTTNGADVAKAIVAITNPNNPVVYTYADGLAALKAGKEIDLSGVGSSLIYDSLRQVYGPWAGYKALDDKGGLQIVPNGNLTAQEVQAANP